MLCTRLLLAFSFVPFVLPVPVSLSFLREAVLTNVDIALTEIQEDIDQGTKSAIVVEDLAKKWAAIGRLIGQAEQRVAGTGAQGGGGRAVLQPQVFTRASGVQEGSMMASGVKEDSMMASGGPQEGSMMSSGVHRECC